MRRVLITGAGGFLGSHCASYAAAAGLQPYLVDRPRNGKAPSERHVYADLLNRAATTQLVRDARPDLLLHLAWITRHNELWTSEENETWVDSSYQLSKAFRQFGGRRAVLVGTCAEYDWRRAGVCSEFATPVEPQTAYGRAKDRLRREAAEHASDVGMSLAWARLFFLYGPGGHQNCLIPWVIRHLRAGDPADCTPGTQIRDLLYVSDVAEAVISLLLSSVTGPVNIGSGHPTTLRDGVTQTAEIIGRPALLRFGARPMPAGEPPRLVADTGRLNNEVHWRPRVSLRDGLLETVAYWKLRGEPPGVTPGQSNRTS